MGKFLNRNEESNLLHLFTEGAEIANQAAVCYQKAWHNQVLNEEAMRVVKDVEHQGDQLVHRALARIESMFITPLDRGDLLNLVASIENITDNIDELANHCYMMHLTQGNEFIDRFVTDLCAATSALKILMEDFVDFKKKREALNESIILINQLEEKSDTTYVMAMRQLYLNPQDPIDVMRYQKIYTLFEKCMDSVEDVADLIATILIAAN